MGVLVRIGQKIFLGATKLSKENADKVVQTDVLLEEGIKHIDKLFKLLH